MSVELTGRRVVVVGLGRSGRAAAALALARGADVVVVDKNPAAAGVPGARSELGPHRLETFLGADVVVVSPGVPAATPEVAAAVAAGVDVVGELGFGWRFVQPRTAAITGTNGKSTVTSFVGRLLETTGRRVFTGGNLGVPLCEVALGEPPELAAIEVSSYQMELPGTFAPSAAVVLNLTPDHLARHGDMRTYGEHKCRLMARMGPEDVYLTPVGDPLLAELAAAHGRGVGAWLGGEPGVIVDGRVARIRLPRVSVDLDLSGVTVPGAHNLEHVGTAAALALCLGADPAAVQAALPTLRALAHRMEPVGERGGVRWINDSKATNLASTSVALTGMDRPCVVLLGGEAKGGGFAELAPALARHRAVVCFGGSGPAIADELEAAGVAVHRVGWLADAVAAARGLALPGDAVLFSPACASFDEFRNFEHRGDVFRAAAQGGA